MRTSKVRNGNGPGVPKMGGSCFATFLGNITRNNLPIRVTAEILGRLQGLPFSGKLRNLIISSPVNIFTLPPGLSDGQLREVLLDPEARNFKVESGTLRVRLQTLAELNGNLHCPEKLLAEEILTAEAVAKLNQKDLVVIGSDANLAVLRDCSWLTTNSEHEILVLGTQFQPEFIAELIKRQSDAKPLLAVLKDERFRTMIKTSPKLQRTVAEKLGYFQGEWGEKLWTELLSILQPEKFAELYGQLLDEADFSQRIEEFLDNHSGVFKESDLLQSEAKAFAANCLWYPKDPSVLNACRREILKRLTGDRQTDYSDLLQTQAKLHLEAGHPARAAGLLLQIKVVEPDNWQVLLTLARAQYRSARYLVESTDLEVLRQAIANFSQVERLMSVAQPEVVAERRLAGLLLGLADRTLGGDQLKAEWAFFVEHLRGQPEVFREHCRNLAAGLRRSQYTWVEFAQVFGVTIEGEPLAAATPLKAVEEVPQRLEIALELLATYEDYNTRELIDGFMRTNKSLGKKVAALLTCFLIRECYQEAGLKGNDQAKKILARHKAYLGATVQQEIRAVMLAEMRRLKDLAAAARAKPKEDRSAEEFSALLAQAAEIRTAALTEQIARMKKLYLKAVMEQQNMIRYALQQEVPGLLADEKTLDFGLLLAAELSTGDESVVRELRPVLAELLQPGLGRVYQQVFGRAAQIWRSMEATAVSLRDGQYPGRKISAKNLIGPENFAFGYLKKIHDFIFVQLGGLPGVVAMFREISDVRFAAPVNWESSWYTIMAFTLCEQPSLALAAHEKALTKDSGNIAAELEIARLLSLSGRSATSERLVERVLAREPEDLVWFRTISLQTTNLMLSSDFKKPGITAGVIARLAAIKTEWTGRMAADPAWLEQDFISDSYGALLHNLGLAHLINFGYEQALEYFDQVLSFRPQETRTLKAKGDTLVLLGRLVEAGDLFKTACQSATDRSLFYAAIADVCLQLDEIPLALQPVEKGLRLNPASRACLLGKAKILARLGQMAESEKVLAQAVAGLKTAPPPSLQEKFLIEGLILMVEAENCFNRGELPESIQLGRQALEAFRKQGDDISLEEIEARCRLVYYLKMSGVEEHLAALKAAEAKDRAASTKTVLKYYHLAYAEALAIIDRVPASPLGRKALIGPAAFLHKDEEVLDQVKWLINYPENITADVLATLLIIIRWAEGDIKMRTETLLEQVLVEMNKIMSPETVQAKMDSARQLAGTIQKP